MISNSENFDSEGNFIPTPENQHYHEPVTPHTGNYASSIVSVILSICFFGLLIVGIVEARSIVAFAGVVLVYVMLVLMPIFGLASLAYPLWRKWHLDRIKIEHARLDVQAKREHIAREQEKHDVRMYLAQSRLFPDANGNRPYVFNPRTYDVVEVSSGNFAQNVPQHFHLEYNNTGSTEQIEPGDELQALPPPVQSFRELLASGSVQAAITQGKMLLGYDVKTNAIRYGSWLDLYSCAIGGVSGSGKTTTVRFLLFQAILAGARLIMIDPHIGNPDESLAAQFAHFTSAHHFKPCDDTVTPVLKRVQWLVKELARRKSTGVKTPALVFVIDEFNALMRIPDIREEMSTLLVSIAQEGRKFGLFAVLMGQRWSQQDIGGANIRTSLASTLAHRFTDEGQAKLLIGGRAGPKCLELQTGHYLFRDTNGGLTEMITPFTTVEDGAIIQQLLTPSTGPLTGYRAGNDETTGMKQPLSNGETTGFIPERTAFTSEMVTPFQEMKQLKQPLSNGEMSSETTGEMAYQGKVDAVKQMLSQGFNQGQIMLKIWGVKAGATEAYRAARTEYLQIVSEVQQS